MLCKENFLTRLENIAKAQPAALILREKDLPEAKYLTLAAQTLSICRRYNVTCILHSFTDAAVTLGADAIHMPLPLLRGMSIAQKQPFSVIGASCHSIADALEAQRLGCTYITAGHIFATDCKKGLPEKGLEFLKDICEAIRIPVYAIGGISSSNIAAVRSSGAAGACIMSGLMQCATPALYLNTLNS